MSGRIRVMLADDHQVVREGLRLFLSEAPDGFEVVAEAANGREAVTLAEEVRPDVILMDLAMPELDGIGTLKALKARGVPSRVLILTTFIDEGRVKEAVEAGAVGYLLKDVERHDLLVAIRNAHEGRPTLHPAAQEQLMRQLNAPPVRTPLDSLTDRERDVLRLLAAGSSNKAIARNLNLSLGTVKGYVSTVLEKLGVSSRTQAALVAVEHGVQSGG